MKQMIRIVDCGVGIGCDGKKGLSLKVKRVKVKTVQTENIHFFGIIYTSWFCFI